MKCYFMTVNLGKKIFLSKDNIGSQDLVRPTVCRLCLGGMWAGPLCGKCFIFSRNLRTVIPPVETYPKERGFCNNNNNKYIHRDFIYSSEISEQP